MKSSFRFFSRDRGLDDVGELKRFRAVWIKKSGSVEELNSSHCDVSMKVGAESK